MRADGERGTARGPAITTADDNRVTLLGRHMRRWRLDELPQVFNVVTGQMALLGPRPEAPSYVDMDDPRWQRVLAARPGIVGPTQVLVADWETDVVARSGEPDAYRSVVLPLKLAVDLWYLRNASPRVDVMVCATLLRRFAGSVDHTALFNRVITEVPEASLLIRSPRAAQAKSR